MWVSLPEGSVPLNARWQPLETPLAGRASVAEGAADEDADDTADDAADGDAGAVNNALPPVAVPPVMVPPVDVVFSDGSGQNSARGVPRSAS